MKLYHLTNERGFETRISAPSQDKAAEIFLAFLVLNDLAVDEFSLRRVKLAEFSDEEAKKIKFHLGLGVEGIMASNALHGPGIIAPYDRRMREDEW